MGILKYVFTRVLKADILILRCIMFAKFKNFINPPKPQEFRDVCRVKLTIELMDGRTDHLEIEGDILQTGLGDMGMDASYIAEQTIKRIFRTGWFLPDGSEAIPPHQVSKILIGERQKLMKEYE